MHQQSLVIRSTPTTTPGAYKQPKILLNRALGMKKKAFCVEDLLSTSYVLGTVLKAKEKSVNKIVQTPCPCGAYILL